MKKSKVLLVSLLASLGVIGISGTSLHYSSQYLNFGIVAKADASVPNAITSRGGSNTDLLSPTDPGYKGTKILQGVQVVSGNEGSSYNTNGIDLLENVKSLDVVVTLQNPTGQSADVSESITLPVNKASGPVFTVGDNTNESLLKSPEKFDLPNNWTLAFGISGYTYTDSPNIADADNTVDTQNKVDAVQFRGTLAAYTKVQVKIPVKVDTEGFTNSGMGALASALYVKDDKGNYQVAGGPLATIGVVDKSIVASDYTANAGVKPEPKLFKVTTPANGDGVTISKIVDANGNNVPIDTTLSTPGIYKVTLNAPGYGSATVALTVTGGSTGGSTGGYNNDHNTCSNPDACN